MSRVVGRWLDRLAPQEYRRPRPLVLVNGLAEQSESWLCNRCDWEGHFDVKVPEILVYDGPLVQRRIDEGLPLNVDYFTNQLELYLDSFVQRPPYNLVASSLGGQIAVEYAARHPGRMGRLALLCPSGFGGEERLPIVEGVRKNDIDSVVASVFHDRRFVRPQIVRHFERLLANRAWRKGLLRTVRGTSGPGVRDRLPLVRCPSLLIVGEEDRIVDTDLARLAVRGLPNFEVVAIPECGHAPQIERATLVNRLVREFLQRGEGTAAHPPSAHLTCVGAE